MRRPTETKAQRNLDREKRPATKATWESVRKQVRRQEKAAEQK